MKKKLNTIICDNILRLRSLRDFTQNEIANAIGIKQSSYNQIELGKTQVSAFHLNQLAKHYNVSVEDFYDRDSKFDRAEKLRMIEERVRELSAKIINSERDLSFVKERNKELVTRNIELEGNVYRRDNKIESLIKLSTTIEEKPVFKFNFRQ